MNSPTSLSNIKPFLPIKGVYLDADVMQTERFGRWFWEDSTDSAILKVMALPDEVINAAASRLFKKMTIGFGIWNLGLSEVEMKVIAGAIFNDPWAVIPQGKTTITLRRLYLQATARTSLERRQDKAVRKAVEMFT
jgi:hypothetical protein